MLYTSKLTLSMAVPTVMVAGAGGSVCVGAIWLAAIAASTPTAELAALLNLGATVIALLTLVCVGACIGFTVWIRRAARVELGADPEEARQLLAEIARGNLAVPVAGAPPGSVLDSIGGLAAQLGRLIAEIRQASESIATASSEIASGSQDLSVRTERTAGSLQATASSMEQLTSAVGQSADSARQANQYAEAASTVARRGGAVVASVVSTMDEIHASSDRIADIIGTIDGIAFQTNILALNAAVEAARAGEQGRGFAVVAGEVRSLAQRAADAAREIKGLIGSSVERVQTGSRLVQEAGSTMDEIVASVQRVTAVIGEITHATSEQSSGLGQVNGTVTQLDHMTQQNAALVEQSAAAAASLKEQAARLTQVVAAFHLDPRASAA